MVGAECVGDARPERRRPRRAVAEHHRRPRAPPAPPHFLTGDDEPLVWLRGTGHRVIVDPEGRRPQPAASDTVTSVALPPVEEEGGRSGDPRRGGSAPGIGGVGLPPPALAAGPGLRQPVRAHLSQPQRARRLRGRLQAHRARAGGGGPAHPVRRRAVLRVGSPRLPARTDLPLHPRDARRHRQLRPARRRREVQAVLQGHRQQQGRVGPADLRRRLLRDAERQRPPVQDRFPGSGPAERDPRRPALRRRRGAGQGPRPRAQQGDALPAGHGLRGRAAHRRAGALHHRHVADRVPAHHVGGHHDDEVLARLLRQRRRPARRLRQPRHRR